MNWLWIFAVIGIAFVALIILVRVFCLFFGPAYVAPVRQSSYTARVTPGQETVIDTLVKDIAPRVRWREFDKKDIDAMLGYSADFDQEMYFRFKTQLADGTLSVENLRRSLESPP